MSFSRQKIFSHIGSYGHPGILAGHCESLPGPLASPISRLEVDEILMCRRIVRAKMSVFMQKIFSRKKFNNHSGILPYFKSWCWWQSGWWKIYRLKKSISWKEYSLSGDKQLSREVLYLSLEYDEHRPGEKYSMRKLQGEIISFTILNRCCHASWVRNDFVSEKLYESPRRKHEWRFTAGV